MIDYRAGVIPGGEQLLALYDSVGWSAYTEQPERLCRAVRASQLVLTAWEDGELVGLLRAVGDGETILYVQDLLIRPDRQRRGIGRTLLLDCVERYQDVRQKVLLTDDTPATTAFYRACGFLPSGELGTVAFLYTSEE